MYVSRDIFFLDIVSTDRLRGVEVHEVLVNSHRIFVTLPLDVASLVEDWEEVAASKIDKLIGHTGSTLGPLVVAKRA